jgi:uncharacterized protein YhfF
MSESIEKFWAACLKRNPEIPHDMEYQTWHFGDSPEMADELASLVMSGRKTATASLQAFNDLHPEMRPIMGVYSVVTDYAKAPLCVIQTTEIRETPFNEVGAEFAADEGEGDLSLEYWRRVHIEYFTKEAAANGLEFNSDSIICCERFKLVFAG